MNATRRLPRGQTAFTRVEVLISMTVVSVVMAMCMSTFLFSLRTMYKDTQRLATNAALRSLMAQVSKETLDASYFYLFPHYTALDGSLVLTTDPAPMTQIIDAADDDYDKWVAHGDCLVLVTKTSQYRTTDIRQIRIHYRVVTSQTQRNGEAAMRYYEAADWGEGTASTSNGHTNLATELNAINLNSNPALSGSRLLAARTIGRKVPSPQYAVRGGRSLPGVLVRIAEFHPHERLHRHQYENHQRPHGQQSALEQQFQLHAAVTCPMAPRSACGRARIAAG